jgi:hypothetical protein
MTRYPANTEVSTDRSIMEIKRILGRYGASAFMYAEDDAIRKAIVSFKVGGPFYKIGVTLPDKNSREFTHTPERGKPRPPQAVEAAYEQAIRQRWRALALAIKAVLEAAESGIWTLEQVLQSFTLLPNDQTVGEWLEPQINEAYLSGKMPKFLPMLEHKEVVGG